MIAVTILLTACLGTMSVAEFEQFGPDVGAIVNFRPGTPSMDLWYVAASTGDTIGADPVSRNAARVCVLSPSVMARGGGSLVVEARRMSSPPIFRVHWAGLHTSDGSGDCGEQADIVLSRTDLQKLANAAGGYGPKIIGP